MGWIGGEVVLNSDSKKDLDYARDMIRRNVRNVGDVGEFPNLGDYLLPIKLKKMSPCKSYEDAMEVADRFNWRRNYNILIPFKDVDSVKKTKKILNLEERIDKEIVKLKEYVKKTDCQNYKSKYIGCPKCGSKINKKYVRFANVLYVMKI